MTTSKLVYQWMQFRPKWAFFESKKINIYCNVYMFHVKITMIFFFGFLLVMSLKSIKYATAGFTLLQWILSIVCQSPSLLYANTSHIGTRFYTSQSGSKATGADEELLVYFSHGPTLLFYLWPLKTEMPCAPSGPQTGAALLGRAHLSPSSSICSLWITAALLLTTLQQSFLTHVVS